MKNTVFSFSPQRSFYTSFFRVCRKHLYPPKNVTAVNSRRLRVLLTLNLRIVSSLESEREEVVSNLGN